MNQTIRRSHGMTAGLTAAWARGSAADTVAVTTASLTTAPFTTTPLPTTLADLLSNTAATTPQVPKVRALRARGPRYRA